jgi:hypothetical protein
MSINIHQKPSNTSKEPQNAHIQVGDRTVPDETKEKESLSNPEIQRQKGGLSPSLEEIRLKMVESAVAQAQTAAELNASIIRDCDADELQDIG